MTSLFSTRSPLLSPEIQRLTEEAVELFYAEQLETMVLDQLRPALSRARATARVPMHKQAMQLQMGRTVDAHQEKDLARAWDRSGRMRWDGLRHGTTVEVRRPYWQQAAEMLTEVRNEVHQARFGAAPVNVQPLITLLDAWHNLPILMVQRGAFAIDPKRIDPQVVVALERFAKATLEKETAELRDVADQAAIDAGHGPLAPRPRRGL